VCFGISGAAFIKITQAMFGVAIAAGFLICILTMFWGRKFCGYICPLGTLQQAIFMLRSPKYRRKNRLAFFYEARLKRIKYLVLIINAILVVAGISYLYMSLCPILTIGRISLQSWKGIIVLVLILGGSFFTDRIWCRFMCPYAALLNLFQGIGTLFQVPRTKIHRYLESCIDCSICNNNCPMNINIADVEVVEDPDCIHCGLCTYKCPKPGTLTSRKK
jgi:polyferredoxin